MARLTALLAQFAADPALRCGEAEMLSADELARLAAVNDTVVPLPATLSALVADQRGRPRMPRRWRTPAGSSAIARCVSRWWRSRSCCVSAA